MLGSRLQVLTRTRRGGITIPWLSGFLLLLLLASATLVWLDATRKVDRLIHDSWVRLHTNTPADDIIIAAIDPESLASLGRWPWARELQAQVLEELARNDVQGVVIDVLHIESASDSADQRLASAVGSLPISVMPVLVERGAGGGGIEKLPISEVISVVSDIGHVHAPIDDDGIVRRVYLMEGRGRAHWPTLSLAALAQFSPDSPRLENLPGTRHADTGPSDGWKHDHEVLIPFSGPSGSFTRVSAARIARGEVPKSELEGRIVFFGLTTTGLGDVVPTPVSALDQPMPGIELHANIFTALRNGTLVTRGPPWLGPLVALLVLPLMLIIYSRAPPRYALPGALIGALLPIAVSYLLYQSAQLWFAPLSASVPILASYLLWSRHRLEYVNRFLERELGKFAAHQPPRGPSDDQDLIEFFENASRHLPLKGWRFDTRHAAYSSGASAPSGREEALVGKWNVHEGVYSKRYRTPAQLRIDLVIDAGEAADEITTYIDSLARVRSRETAIRTRSSVERLQSNAERLREQMAWLRGVKEFSEAVMAGGPIGFIVWNPAGEWVRGNALVREALPVLGDRALLIDFLDAVGLSLGTGHWDEQPPVDERQRLHRERYNALLFDGVPWQVSHEEGERALVVNFSAVGHRLSRRLICASVIDVSEIRSAERARAELVDYLSHDLRSPLVSALAMLGDADAEAIGGMPRDRNSPPDLATHIRSSLSMMDELLNVARADSLNEAQFSDLLLDDVVENALSELLPQARARGVRFEVTDIENELWMSGDAGSLVRTVINIVGNAIKYSEDDTTVRIGLSRQGDEGVLTVDDEGVGIDPDVIDEIFTRFRRDARVAGRIAGTGLGLAFVSRVVRAHAGTIKATSAPGRGTRVTLSLPLERNPVIADDREAAVTDATVATLENVSAADD